MESNTRQANYIARVREACKTSRELYEIVQELKKSFDEEFGTDKNNSLNALEGDTTVNEDSNSGTKDLNVASVIGFRVDDFIIINKGGSREEIGEIASIDYDDGILTLDDNLEFTHTAVDADTVQMTGSLYEWGLNYSSIEKACNQFMTQYMNFWEGSAVSTREYGADARRVASNE